MEFTREDLKLLEPRLVQIRDDLQDARQHRAFYVFLQNDFSFRVSKGKTCFKCKGHFDGILLLHVSGKDCKYSYGSGAVKDMNFTKLVEKVYGGGL